MLHLQLRHQLFNCRSKCKFFGIFEVLKAFLFGTTLPDSLKYQKHNVKCYSNVSGLSGPTTGFPDTFYELRSMSEFITKLSKIAPTRRTPYFDSLKLRLFMYVNAGFKSANVRTHPGFTDCRKSLH